MKKIIKKLKDKKQFIIIFVICTVAFIIGVLLPFNKSHIYLYVLFLLEFIIADFKSFNLQSIINFPFIFSFIIFLIIKQSLPFNKYNTIIFYLLSIADILFSANSH